MTNEEYQAVSLMLEKLKANIENIFDKHNREFEAMFFGAERIIDCVECEKEHDKDKSCLEAGVERLNV